MAQFNRNPSLKQLETATQNFKTVSTVYILTLKDGSKVRCPVSALTSRFSKIGKNFQERLKQFQELFPGSQVIDLEMVDIENGK